MLIALDNLSLRVPAVHKVLNGHISILTFYPEKYQENRKSLIRPE